MQDKTTYLTKDGHIKLLTELEHLKKVLRPIISNRIKEAKELGDLAENAEYADAREEQSFTEGRIIELEAMLKDVHIIANHDKDPEVVQIGDNIVVDKNGARVEYTIVGSNEADPPAGKISNESPLGQSFLSRKKGESFTVKTPKGELSCTIVDIKV